MAAPARRVLISPTYQTNQLSRVPTMTHAIEKLWARHAPKRGYPAGVVAVPKPIPGVAFFPGGHGLWRADDSKNLPPLPRGGVMVLGHDFHSVAGYRESFKLGRESETQPTWRNMLELFRRVPIDPEECFFTNVYMGLRSKGKTGPFPGATDPAFVSHCVEFLSVQLSEQRPSLVITLGMNVPPLLAHLSRDLNDWTEQRGIKHLDGTGPVRTKVRFAGIPSFSTTVVALIHPSLRHGSLRFRSYRGMVGDVAEVAMLRDAMAARARDITKLAADGRV